MSDALPPAALAVLGVLASARIGRTEPELDAALASAGLPAGPRRTALDLVRDRGWVAARSGIVDLTPAGIARLLDAHSEIEAALDPSPKTSSQEECPSIPWLTTVQTCWIDAISVNYAVDPAVLAAMLPKPLTPEIHKGTAWVQVLMSSLRDMRPQGMPSLFGVNFYQVSYRAAVTWNDPSGARRRGGYFVRSETNHPVMRAVGNKLVEFKFHDFGAAEMVMMRDGERLTIGVDPPSDGKPMGKLVGMFDTRPLDGPPAGSVWTSLAEVHEPLVECYDALGVDRENGWLYILTIDRDPWRAVFVKPEEIYCEWAEALPKGAARLDSVLHVRECPYRWRPLRREKLA